MEDNVKIHERLAVVETNIKAIMDNHLPHIQKTVDKLGSKFWAIIILLVANLTGAIVALIK